MLSNAILNDLLKEIINCDREALKQLYINIKMPIFLFVKSLVKKHELAEDITQQVFIEIIESVNGFKIGTNAKTWIFSIARNLSVDALKKQNREISSDDCDFKELCYENRLNEKTLVYEALNQLDDIERQIIVLYIYCGFKQVEIAKLLNLPYIKVRSKYAYAIRKLKLFYED